MKYLLFALLILVNTSWAIDNPDAPDYVAEFELRMQPLENYIYKEASNTLEYAQGYDELESALDKELNLAYRKLMKRLPDESKEALKLSQRQWIKYRDLEFSFVSTNFTRAEFGSSAGLTRGGFRTTLIKDRVKLLLWYLKNHS